MQEKNGNWEVSQTYLNLLKERERCQRNRIEGVQTVLVVLSSAGMVFDIESLRQKILAVYPDSVIFFRTTSGKNLGVHSPQRVSLLIDLTGPGQRQNLFYSKKLRKMSKFVVGRNAGFFRKGSYDRIFDEKAQESTLPKSSMERERIVQVEVLALAGIPIVPAGDLTSDRAKTIALELPPLAGEG